MESETYPRRQTQEFRHKTDDGRADDSTLNIECCGWLNA